MKNLKAILLALAVGLIAGLLMVLLGVPGAFATPLAVLVLVLIWAWQSHRPVTTLSPAERDRLLAQGPPPNSGLVYIHRPASVGGLAIGFDVKLDNLDVTQLRVARFTRLVVPPGTHQLVVGPPQKSAQFQNAVAKQTAQTTFMIHPGEIIVFGFRYGEGAMLRPLELFLEPDLPAAFAKLAKVKMVAAEQPSGLTHTTPSSI